MSQNPIAIEDQIARIRIRMVDSVILALVVLSIPAMAAYLYRMGDVGRQDVYIQIPLLFGIWILAIVRWRLSLRVRVFVLLALLFSLGCTSLVTFGLIGSAFVFLFVCVFLATSLSGHRAGAVVIA